MTMDLLSSLNLEMMRYYHNDPKRIQHFTKVHAYAKYIGTQEGLTSDTLFTLEAAALVHDIGIKSAEEKYGKCNGQLQELEGPAIARQLLERLNFDTTVIDRVCYLVGHHHTYTDVNGIDYRILLEADYLVNQYEDNLPKSSAKHALGHIFEAATGKELCKLMYL